MSSLDPDGQSTAPSADPTTTELGRLRARMVDHLAEHHVATLATATSGDLWASSVFYANDAVDLVFVSSPSSRHAANIAVSGRIAATIDAHRGDWRDIRGIQLEGHASPQRGQALLDALDVYLTRFPWAQDLVSITNGVPPPDESAREAPSGAVLTVDRRATAVEVFRIRPTRMLLLDNRLGFGHREELLVAPDAS